MITTASVVGDPYTKTISFEYSLIDDNGKTVWFDSMGNIVPEGTSGAKSTYTDVVQNDNYQCFDDEQYYYTNICRLDLTKQSHRKYYFKSIKCTLGVLESEKWMDFYCYGYQSVNAQCDKPYSIEFKVEYGPQKMSSFDSYIRYVDYKEVSLVPEVTWLENDTLEAGKSIEIEGCIWSYPDYGNMVSINELYLGVVLPNGVSIDEEYMEFEIGGEVNAGKKVNVKSVNVRTNTETGMSMWIIELDPEVYIGYYNERLELIDDGWIDFYMPLKADSDVKNINMYTHEMFFASSKCGYNAAPGYNTIWNDEWDLNQDNVGKGDTDGIGCIDEKYTQLISVMGSYLALSVNDSISLKGAGRVNKNKAMLKDEGDVVTYNVELSSVEKGTLSDYVHYVAIPRNDTPRDSFLLQGNTENSFDMNLVEAVSCSNIFNVLYTVEKGASFNDLKDLKSTYWYREAKLLESYSFEDVTAIKIVLKDTVQVEKGAKFNAQIKLKADGAKNSIKIGDINEWKSRAYYEFTYSGGKVGGYFGTPGCGVESGIEVVMDGPQKKDDNVEKYDDTPATYDEKWYRLRMYIVCNLISMLGIAVASYLYKNNKIKL